MTTALKHLILVRHAKSSWSHPELADRDRPLNKRRKRDAPIMGSRLAQSGYRPDQILSSPANRALTTAQVIAQAVGFDPDDITVDERIYGAGVGGLIQLLQDTDDRIEHAMLFGHNPELTAMVNRLALVTLDNLPTCGMAKFLFDLDSWTHLGSEPAVETDIDYPKREH